MTTHQPVITSFRPPMGTTIAGIFHSITRYFELRSQSARFDCEMKVLRAMAPHMLSDIGLKGFSRMSPIEQESLLLETIRKVHRT